MIFFLLLFHRFPLPSKVLEKIIERHDRLNIKGIRIPFQAIGGDHRQMDGVSRTSFRQERLTSSPQFCPIGIRDLKRLGRALHFTQVCDRIVSLDDEIDLSPLAFQVARTATKSAFSRSRPMIMS